MARYTVGFNSTVTTTGAGRWQLRAGSADRIAVVEIGLTIAAATASTYGLYRSATLGTASTTIVPVPHDPADGASAAVFETAWSAAPTISTNVALRRVSLPATIGAGFIWQFYDKPVMVAVSAGLILWGLSTTANSQDIYVTYED